MQSKGSSSYLPSIYACWIWHSLRRIPLPRCHRASPSTSLDKKYYSVKNKKPLLEKEEGKLKKSLGLFLSIKSYLLDLAQNQKFRCRGVIGPVPQPLLIRSIFTLFIF